jgi:phosphonate transport system substrate-binding protein
MSDTNEATKAGARAFSPLRLAITVLVVASVGIGAYFVARAQIQGDNQLDEAARVRKAMGMGEPVTNRLGAGYIDANDDLVADTPKDTDQLLDPDELTFSFIATEAPEAYAEVWQPLVSHLSQAIGRPVTYVPYASRDEQLRAIRDGELHLAGLNTGAVPIAVNACGFVPVCAPGKAGEADAYKMVVIAPADTKLKSLKDLAGKRFAFTQPSSNSGCKAAVVALQEAGLALGEDYDAVFTHGHAQLIEAIAEKEYVAGSTASDLLERAMQEDAALKKSIKIIYESEPFPTAALGMTHKLDPALAKKLAEALGTFRFAGTALETEYAATGADAMVPIDYKDDFALIRRIDDAVGYDHRRVLEQSKDAGDDAQEKDADE